MKKETLDKKLTNIIIETNRNQGDYLIEYCEHCETVLTSQDRTQCPSCQYYFKGVRFYAYPFIDHE